MQAPDFLGKHLWPTAAVAGLLLGVAGGLLWPLPNVAVAKADELSVAVPSRAALSRYSDADFSRVRDGTLWSGSTGAQAGSAKVSNWRLLGVLLRPWHAALVEAEKKQSRVGVDQALPDGAILRRVTAEGIEFERKGCHFRQPLYLADEVPIPSAGCSAAPKQKTRKKPSRRSGAGR